MVLLCSLKNLTDACVREIGLRCPILQSLNLAACDKITELGLACVARGCRDIQVCPQRIVVALLLALSDTL